MIQLIIERISMSGILFGLTVGFVAGFLIGFIVGRQRIKELIKMEKLLGLIIFFVWLIMHIYGFMNNKQVPIIFDIVGAGSVSAMLGVKASNDIKEILINRLKNGK